MAGEAKQGKSSVVTALLGRAVLPVGPTPLTTLATTVRYGAEERVIVGLALRRHAMTRKVRITTQGL